MSTLFDAYVERHEDWQRSLIFVKKEFSDLTAPEAVEHKEEVEHRQLSLHDAVSSGSRSTWRYFEEKLSISSMADWGVEIPELPNPLTAGEMDTSLPEYAEQQLGKLWADAIPVAYAATPAFWTLCHTYWIRTGKFGEDIATVFFRNPADQEARVRNLLRRMGGLHYVRYNVTSFLDCPIAKGWWRWRFATSASNHAENSGWDLSHRDAHRVLRNGPLWERMIELSLKQVTAINAAKARSAVIAVFSRNYDRVEAVGGRNAARLSCQRIAQLSHTHCLEFIDWNDLYVAAEEALYSQD